jgi:putative transposase
VDWYYRRRLHSACADLPPAEYEDNHYRQLASGEEVKAFA